MGDVDFIKQTATNLINTCQDFCGKYEFSKKGHLENQINELKKIINEKTPNPKKISTFIKWLKNSFNAIQDENPTALVAKKHLLKETTRENLNKPQPPTSEQQAVKHRADEASKGEDQENLAPKTINIQRKKYVHPLLVEKAEKSKKRRQEKAPAKSPSTVFEVLQKSRELEDRQLHNKQRQEAYKDRGSPKLFHGNLSQHVIEDYSPQESSQPASKTQAQVQKVNTSVMEMLAKRRALASELELLDEDIRKAKEEQEKHIESGSPQVHMQGRLSAAIISEDHFSPDKPIEEPKKATEEASADLPPLQIQLPKRRSLEDNPLLKYKKEQSDKRKKNQGDI